MTFHEIDSSSTICCWIFLKQISFCVVQGHCWPGEIQQHHLRLLQGRQGNSASVRYHKAGDLRGPAQMDENDRQGKETAGIR